jgi:polyphosphate glucokinase
MKTIAAPEDIEAPIDRDLAETASPGPTVRTLAIDIGGTGLKACILDANGKMITERVRVKTPPQCPPRRMVQLLAKLVAPLAPFDQVSVGFPGVVRRGKVLTAHNLGSKAWHRFDLDLALTKALGKPVRVLNDADIQGLGAIKGHGVEVVITLGTGLGSSIFEDGRLSVHIELAHHPFRRGNTYEEQLGKAALHKAGRLKWNKRVAKAIDTVRALTHFDHLYFGGGNAAHITFKLPDDVSIVSNEMGLCGGIWLWRERSPGSTDIFRRGESTAAGDVPPAEGAVPAGTPQLEEVTVP